MPKILRALRRFLSIHSGSFLSVEMSVTTSSLMPRRAEAPAASESDQPNSYWPRLESSGRSMSTSDMWLPLLSPLRTIPLGPAFRVGSTGRELRRLQRLRCSRPSRRPGSLGDRTPSEPCRLRSAVQAGRLRTRGVVPTCWCSRRAKRPGSTSSSTRITPTQTRAAPSRCSDDERLGKPGQRLHDADQRPARAARRGRSATWRRARAASAVRASATSSTIGEHDHDEPASVRVHDRDQRRSSRSRMRGTSTESPECGPAPETMVPTTTRTAVATTSAQADHARSARTAARPSTAAPSAPGAR